MIYIKLESDMSLVVTESNPIYRGDSFNQNVVVLTPAVIDNINMTTATIYMSVFRADGTADVDLLTRMDEEYQNGWLQYAFPVTSTISRYPGTVCMFLSIYAGSANSPMIAKSGECVLQIHESTCMDEYIGDRCISLIYQVQKTMQDKIETLSYDMLQNKPVTNITGVGVVISDLATGVYNIVGTWKITEDDEERMSADDDLFYVLNDGESVRLTWISADGTKIYGVPVGGTIEEIETKEVPTSGDNVVLDGGHIGS